MIRNIKSNIGYRNDEMVFNSDQSANWRMSLAIRFKKNWSHLPCSYWLLRYPEKSSGQGSGMRHSVCFGKNGQNRSSDTQIFSGENSMNPISWIFSFLERHYNHLLLVTSNNLPMRLMLVCTDLPLPFGQITSIYWPPPLCPSVLQFSELRERLSLGL